jgi:FAD/FMN-containing dehydrogenase
MTEITVTTLDGGHVRLPAERLAQLKAELRGQACLPGEPGYAEACTIWNAMIERQPALAIRAAGPGDVVRAVGLARELNALLAVRGGGHNIAGNALCDGGLLLDLSQMRAVRVDPAARRAWVEPGATLGDVDRETQTHALAVPTGVNSTTGIAGLTLGGGFGWITRKYGLTIDNLLSADVVTSDGRFLRASAGENAELFWALRGGGGNFGVVTAFEFALHPVGPQVLSGLIVHPFEHAEELLRAYRKLVAEAPEELTLWVVMRQAPPLPFLPTEVHGKNIFIFALCHVGDMAAGERAVAPLRALGTPIADVVSPHSFVGWQAAFDPLLTAGARNYWKSHDLLELSDAAIGKLVQRAAPFASPECEVFIAHVGGAMTRVPTEATAFPQRKPHFVMNVHGRWREKADDTANVGWARGIFDAMAPHAADTGYVNFMPADEKGAVKRAYGPQQARLAEVKARFDPDNRLRVNHNIQPARSKSAAA